MRRAVIFATLALLLLAVAGVTVAQEEGAFDAGAPSGSSGETTVLEGTSPARETTQPGLAVPEVTAPGTTLPEGTVPNEGSPGAGGGPAAEDEGRDEPSEKPDQPDGGQYGDGATRPEPVAEADKERGSERGAGRPEGRGKPEKNAGEGGDGRSGSAGEAGKAEGGGGGQEKATVCHKGKKTLSVGAPARDAHLRHGDTPGACA